MEPMDWLENEELLRFFRRKKTEMSCMENPHTFLSQLRDHDLVPEDRYKKVSRMRSKDNIRKGLYDILDWLERERPQSVRKFWRCVFNETILNQYPTLRLLRNSLMDGPFHFEQLPEKAETEESDEGKRKTLSEGEEGEEKQNNSVKKKRKLRSRSVRVDEEELAGPSAQLTPRKRSKKISLAAVTDEEEEEEEIEQQPKTSHDSGRKVFRVTCGAAAATLHEKRFASGTRGKSIRTETSWMTPVEFLEVAPRQTNASWRTDIKYEGEPLSVLIKANILDIHLMQCNCRLCKPEGEDLENEKNDDECCICKKEKKLVMCDDCPRSFHQKCHLPHVEDVILRADEEQTFAVNPCLYLNDYSAVVKSPMWLGHIADKLQKNLYQTVGEFVTDVQLIFSNCASYNPDNAEFLARGDRLKELFDREFKSVLNISE